jgi:hypothetical protein
MSYSKLDTVLRKDIALNKANGNAKVELDLRQMLSALNNVLKYELVNKDSLSICLTDGLDSLLDKYKDILIENRKADVRGPLVRLRKLSKYYVALTEFKTDDLTFSDIMKEGLKRKYGEGDVFHQGEMIPSEQTKIKQKYKTYREVCIEMVKAGVAAHPELWPRVKIDVPGITKTKLNKQLDSPARNIRDWITGDTSPSSSIPEGRLRFIEDYLCLPKYVLVKKAQLLNNRTHTLNETEKRTKKKVKQKAGNFVIKKLNQNFKKYYDEYSEYKIHHKRPALKNITESMKNDRHALKRLKVRELQGDEEVKWTAGGNGSIGAANKFYYTLKAFINYCVVYQNIKEEDVDLYHLTDTDIIEELVVAASEGKIGGSVVYDILTIIKVSGHRRGYLRLCGNPGDRTLDEYFSDLDLIIEESPIWRKSATNAIKKLGKGKDQGKQNILFLLNMELDERLDINKKVVNKLIQKAKSNLLEADSFLDLANSKNKKEHIKDKFKRQASGSIIRAYHEATSAMIYHVSFVNCPRIINWSMLNYYESVSVRDNEFSSLTYHRHKNRFELYIPTHGPSIIKDEEIRYLKNANSNNVVKVNVLLPEYLTSTIKLFLDARKYYVDFHMPFSIPLIIEQNIKTIEKLKKGEIFGLSIKEIQKLKEDRLSEINSLIKEDELSDFDGLSEEGILKIVEAEIKKTIEVESLLDKKYADVLVDTLKLDNEEHEKFDRSDVKPLIVWSAKHKDLYNLKRTTLEGLAEAEDWYVKRAFGRKNYIAKTSLGAQFKLETRDAFYDVDSELEQVGINAHGMRHLAAETHLDRYPGDFIGAAAIINDDVEQVHKTYGTKDRSHAMKRLGDLPE